MAEDTEKQFDLPHGSDQRILAWEAPEFVHHEKGFGWLLSVWLIAIILAGASLWYYQVTFLGVLSVVVILAAALALSTQGRLKPEIIRITIDGQGVTMKGHLYAWGDLKSFWLVFLPTTQALYIETTHRLVPIITILLGKTDPEQVRSLLLDRLPEQSDRAEQFSDRLSRLIRF